MEKKVISGRVVMKEVFVCLFSTDRFVIDNRVTVDTIKLQCPVCLKGTGERNSARLLKAMKRERRKTCGIYFLSYNLFMVV